MQFICRYIFYPWYYTNFDVVMDNFASAAIILLAVPTFIFMIISKKFKLSSREANTISYYLIIALVCSMFFNFYWYIALLLSVLLCCFTKWISKYDLRYMEKEELNEIIAINKNKIKMQKQEQDKISTYEKQLSKEECKKKVHPVLRLKLIFTLSFISPVIMIIILELLGFRYRL